MIYEMMNERIYWKKLNIFCDLFLFELKILDARRNVRQKRL